MNNAEKKGLAKELYMHSTDTQKAIAERVKVTEKTISKWVEEGNWKNMKAAQISTKDEIVSRYMRMIGKILELAETEDRVITDAEADRISKLNKAKDAIDKELGLSVFVQVFQEYNSYLIPLNPELAKENNSFQNKFINNKAIGKQ